MSGPRFDRFRLNGLNLAPPQTLGPIRIVPIINTAPRDDIRIGLQGYDSYGVVTTAGMPDAPKRQYFSYIPHGLIVSWSSGDKQAAAYGAELRKNTDPPRPLVTTHQRMAKRVDSNALRILPLHLAMEGFLGLHFRGPDIAWSNYSKNAQNFGLSPRTEFSTGGQRIDGLAEAMRLFEIHDNQVGMLLFIADSLASTFIVSHPEDYRRLHTSLLQDFFAEFFIHYARYAEIGSLDLDLHTNGVTDLASLAVACEDVRTRWHDQSTVLASGLVERELTPTLVNRMGPFQLERFITDLSEDVEGHIGEAIVHDSGRLQYLKSYRLSKNQIKRAHLLQMLAAHDWSIEGLAAAHGDTVDDVIRRMHNVGFAYLLNPEVLAKATRSKRK